eukprot:4668147-Amphidinium_carterae.1
MRSRASRGFLRTPTSSAIKPCKLTANAEATYGTKAHAILAKQESFKCVLKLSTIWGDETVEGTMWGKYNCALSFASFAFSLLEWSTQSKHSIEFTESYDVYDSLEPPTL